MIKNNVLATLSEKFSVRIINMSRYLNAQKGEYVISKQILRSGTSIGANIAESVFAQSRADFINKLSIALKESNETKYWLLQLYKTEMITQKEYDSMLNDLKTIIGTLVNVIKKLKESEKIE